MPAKPYASVLGKTTSQITETAIAIESVGGIMKAKKTTHEGVVGSLLTDPTIRECAGGTTDMSTKAIARIAI